MLIEDDVILEWGIGSLGFLIYCKREPGKTDRS
jgi:hypothetical protein